jgi:DNA modification methylase
MNSSAGSNPTCKARKAPRRCNQLDGRQWLRNSISVWSDIRKSAAENRLKHPAMFPTQLVERLIETFLPAEGRTVLDPFTGSGSTLVAAAAAGRTGIGLELSPEYVALTRERLAEFPETDTHVHPASATDLLQFVGPESIDLCITSPPYWDILNQRRTADYKAVRHYGNLENDLGVIADYDEFLDAIADVFSDVLTALRPGAYCCIVVMDLRKKDRFFPFHSDLAQRLVARGWRYDDLIVWNRQAEYNNLRPLGYPSVFRVNKVHEFILLMQKPRA